MDFLVHPSMKGSGGWYLEETVPGGNMPGLFIISITLYNKHLIAVLRSEKTTMQRKQKSENTLKQRQKQRLNSEYTSVLKRTVLFNLIKVKRLLTHLSKKYFLGKRSNSRSMWKRKKW